MSILKKGAKAIGKLVKGAASLVKKHWRTLVVVGLSVFTMGLATVGFAGFAGAMGAGGFGGFMSAVGSTMYAGATAALGSLGIGGGAQGAAAIAGGVEGAGLMGGHLAAALGSESAKAGIAAQTAALPGSGVTLTPLATAPTSVTTSAIPGAPVVGQPLTSAAPVAAKAGMGDLAKAALITTGGSALSGFAQGKMLEEDDPKAFWGVDLRKKKEKEAVKGIAIAPTVPYPEAPQPMRQPGLMDMPWLEPVGVPGQ